LNANSIVVVAGATAIAFLLTNRHLTQQYKVQPEMRPKEIRPEAIVHAKQPIRIHRPAELTALSTTNDVKRLSDHYSLTIEPKYLQIAYTEIETLRQTIVQLEATLEFAARSSVQDPEELAEKLTLRLMLGSPVKEQLQTILSEHTQKQVLYAANEGRQSIAILKLRLIGDPQDLTYYYALNAKRREGETLTGEENAFYDEFQRYGPTKADMVWEELFDPGEWYENEDVVAALKAPLTTEQQAELAAVVQEHIGRDREAAAYKRTSILTQRLGLNEADRLALFEYLYRNPDASNADIAEQLSPELRELVPMDDPPNTTTYTYPSSR